MKIRTLGIDTSSAEDIVGDEMSDAFIV